MTVSSPTDGARYTPQQQPTMQRLARAAAPELGKANALEKAESATGFYMAAIV
jgi:hypothetical protein